MNFSERHNNHHHNNNKRKSYNIEDILGMKMIKTSDGEEENESDESMEDNLSPITTSSLDGSSEGIRFALFSIRRLTIPNNHFLEIPLRTISITVHIILTSNTSL